MHVVEIHVDAGQQAQVDREPLRRAALEVLRSQCIEAGCELAVKVTRDEPVQVLNRRHRGVDAPTDVLAFADGVCEPFVDASGGLRYLGDIVISLDRAEAQAAEAGHPVLTELQLLVVHGVLHLLGYDDQSDGQRAKMWAVQAEVLQSLGLDINPPL
jgi:probable rRNA maturation factor